MHCVRSADAAVPTITVAPDAACVAGFAAVLSPGAFAAAALRGHRARAAAMEEPPVSADGVVDREASPQASMTHQQGGHLPVLAASVAAPSACQLALTVAMCYCQCSCPQVEAAASAFG